MGCKTAVYVCAVLGGLCVVAAGLFPWSVPRPTQAAYNKANLWTLANIAECIRNYDKMNTNAFAWVDFEAFGKRDGGFSFDKAFLRERPSPHSFHKMEGKEDLGRLVLLGEVSDDQGFRWGVTSKGHILRIRWAEENPLLE